jgi:hypothetical protein
MIFFTPPGNWRGISFNKRFERPLPTVARKKHRLWRFFCARAARQATVRGTVAWDSKSF